MWLVKLKASDKKSRTMWIEMTSFGHVLTPSKKLATRWEDSVTAWKHAETAGTELAMAFQAMPENQTARRPLKAIKEPQVLEGPKSCGSDCIVADPTFRKLLSDRVKTPARQPRTRHGAQGTKAAPMGNLSSRLRRTIS